MRQGTLFDDARVEPRRVDRVTAAVGVAETSRLAAESIDPRQVRGQARAVLDELLRRGRRGATAAQLAAAVGIEQAKVTARLSKLYRLGLAQQTDRVRRNGSGMWATVVVACRFAAGFVGEMGDRVAKGEVE